MEMGNDLGSGNMGDFAVVTLDVHLLLLDARAQEPPGGAHEVAGIAGALEAHEVGAHQAVDDGVPPRQLGEDFRRGKRDVVEEADPEVGPRFAQQPGHQLQLVVLDPHGGAVVCMAYDGVGEPLVDPAVGVPPGPVELRGSDHVVVQGPQGGVGEALVIQLNIVGAELYRDEIHPAVAERFDRLIRRAVPAHPGAVGLGHHRSQCGHQAAG